MDRDLKPAIRLLISALKGVLAQSSNPEYVLQTVLQQAVRHTTADRGVLVEIAPSGKMDFCVLYKWDRDAGGDGGFSRTILRKVRDTGQPVMIADAMHDDGYASSRSLVDLRIISVLCVPIRMGGRIGAIVHLENDRQSHFNSAHLDFALSLADVAGPALEALLEGRRLLETVERTQDELAETRDFFAKDFGFGRFIGSSQLIRDLAEKVRKYAATDAPVLITGETGTGKSLLARIIHSLSLRSKRKLATVTCPNLERSLVESTLFGHVRGAFTEAHRDQVGVVQDAAQGTLFLDEIGELPDGIQAKLLRLVESKRFHRVGDPAELSADVRIIAATNRDLTAAVNGGTFRRDLHARLNFLPIRVPPLRERREDIPKLLRHFLDQTDAGRWIELPEETVSLLRTLQYDWPENVRQIDQLATRLAAEGEHGPATPEVILRHLDLGSASAPPPSEGSGWVDLTGGLEAALLAFERRCFDQVIAMYPRAKEQRTALGLKERTFFDKLAKHGLRQKDHPE